MDLTAYLLSLFSSAFISSTLLPGGSEALVVWGMKEFADALPQIVATASLGNTAGALLTYWIGRVLPQRVKNINIERFKKWGMLSLLFSWLPVVGDGFCLAAGWMRTPFFVSALLIAAGKTARYLAIAYGAGLLWQ